MDWFRISAGMAKKGGRWVGSSDRLTLRVAGVCRVFALLEDGKACFL